MSRVEPTTFAWVLHADSTKYNRPLAFARRNTFSLPIRPRAPHRDNVSRGRQILSILELTTLASSWTIRRAKNCARIDVVIAIDRVLSRTLVARTRGKLEADRNRGTDDDSGKRETSRGKPGDKWRTRGSRSRLTCAGQLDRVPFSVAESGRSRSERIDSSMAAARVHDRDPMGNRKWPRGVRGCPCVRLAYVKFTSGLPRNYHCGNSGEPGGWRWGKGRWERWQRERKRKD